MKFHMIVSLNESHTISFFHSCPPFISTIYLLFISCHFFFLLCVKHKKKYSNECALWILSSGKTIACLFRCSFWLSFSCVCLPRVVFRPSRRGFLTIYVYRDSYSMQLTDSMTHFTFSVSFSLTFIRQLVRCCSVSVNNSNWIDTDIVSFICLNRKSIDNFTFGFIYSLLLSLFQIFFSVNMFLYWVCRFCIPVSHLPPPIALLFHYDGIPRQ